MKTITKKYIVDYITKEYGGLKPGHDAGKMAKAINKTAKDNKEKPVDLFFYIIERADTIPFATSYGFDTAYGRQLREEFESNYYSL